MSKKKQRWRITRKGRYIPNIRDKFNVYVITKVINTIKYGHLCHQGQNLICTGKDTERVLAEGREFNIEDFWFERVA